MSDSELVRTCLPRRPLMAGKRAIFFEAKEQFHGASEDAEKTTARQVKLAGLAANPCHGIHGADCVPGAAVVRAGVVQRLHVDNLRFWKDLDAPFLRQVQVVEVERVFCAEAAAHHATAAARAGGAGRTFPAEEWIRTSFVARFSFWGLEDANTGAVERVAASGGFRGFLQKKVGGAEDAVLSYAEHAAPQSDSGAASPISSRSGRSRSRSARLCRAMEAGCWRR